MRWTENAAESLFGDDSFFAFLTNETNRRPKSRYIASAPQALREILRTTEGLRMTGARTHT